MTKLNHYRFTRSQTILHITLKDYAIRFGKSKSLIHRLQSVTVGGETGENRGIDGTSEKLNIYFVNFILHQMYTQENII